jgi:hypothetical protein
MVTTVPSDVAGGRLRLQLWVMLTVAISMQRGRGRGLHMIEKPLYDVRGEWMRSSLVFPNVSTCRKRFKGLV